jgi:hypothetical protein
MALLFVLNAGWIENASLPGKVNRKSRSFASHPSDKRAVAGDPGCSGWQSVDY